MDIRLDNGSSAVLEVTDSFVSFDHRWGEKYYNKPIIESIQIETLSIWKYLLALLAVFPIPIGLFLLDAPTTGVMGWILLGLSAFVVLFLLGYSAIGFYYGHVYGLKVQLVFVSGNDIEFYTSTDNKSELEQSFGLK